jgi:hypothetical protein
MLPTSTVSTAVFHLPNGATAAATMIHKLHHNLREPACSVNIVPSLVGNSLLSTVKMVYDDKEVNFYDTATTKITVSADAILKGWQCPRAKLWRVPLVDNVHNENTDTLLLDHPHKHDCLNSLYEVESTSTTREHINAIMLQTIGREYIHNVHKLPSIEPTIRYLHEAAGVWVEKTWLKAIRQGNYNSWPLINITNVARYFPKSEEMQKGHMRSQQQGICSTKKKPLDVFPNTPAIPHMKAKGIYLFASTNLRRQYTLIKWGVSYKSPALAASSSWSFTMSTATLHEQRPSRTTPAGNLSWPGHKPWSKCKRRTLSQNTKSWTTKHQRHTRRPSATQI